MSATDNLKEEHEVILRMIRILTAASDKFDSGEEILLKYSRRLWTSFTHSQIAVTTEKEQDTLFPLLGQRGIPTASGPIAVMLMEHEQGRRYVKDLSNAVKKYQLGEKDAKEGIVENAREYAKLLEQHIYKEDNILYPMGDRVLSSHDNQELLEKFDKIEKEIIGEGKHEYYLQVISELEKELGMVGGEMEHEHH